MTPDPLEALRLPIVPVEPRPEFAASLLRRLRQEQPPAASRGATVRYFVADLDAAVAFYLLISASRWSCGLLRPSPCSTTAACACC